MKNIKTYFNIKKCNYILDNFYNVKTAKEDYFLTIIKGNKSVQLCIDKETYEYIKRWET